MRRRGREEHTHGENMKEEDEEERKEEGRKSRRKGLRRRRKQKQGEEERKDKRGRLGEATNGQGGGESWRGGGIGGFS